MRLNCSRSLLSEHFVPELMCDKKRIFIASVLKPTEDSRMYFKFGLSLRETNKYEVYILGFSRKKTGKNQHVHLYSLFSKNRIHPSRLFAPFRLILHLFEKKPAIVILTTYELIPALLISRCFLHFKLIYDVQENYSLNVLSNQTLPPGIRQLAASWIRWWEKRIHPYIDHYLFAEQCYQAEFPHITNYAVVENKFSGMLKTGSPISFSGEKPIRFILAGTLTPVFGIANGMKWFIQFEKYFPNQTLHVIGHCPLNHYRETLEHIAKDHPQISLDLSDNPLPYENIQSAISHASCWLMPYHNLPTLAAKIPTKLYEGIAQRKVVLISTNRGWESILERHTAGIPVDFHKASWSKVEMEKVYQRQFYTALPEAFVLWSTEAHKLLAVVDTLLGD